MTGFPDEGPRFLLVGMGMSEAANEDSDGAAAGPMSPGCKQCTHMVD